MPMRGILRTIFCTALVPALLMSAPVRALQLDPLGLAHASNLIDLDMLRNIRSSSSQLNSPMQELEVSCFATGLYHEARGETRDGQLAVAQVILNRIKSTAYPDTACGVIYQNAHMQNRCQFSFACDLRSDDAKNLETYANLKQMAARTLRLGYAPFPAESPAANAARDLNEITHYHTVAVSPAWGQKIEKIATIGAHIFYRSERVAKSL